jgi:hypothetical protein
VRVAELLVAIRIKLIEIKLIESAVKASDAQAKDGKPEDGDESLPGALKIAVTLVDENLRDGHYEGAIKIASAIAGEVSAIAGEASPRAEKIRRERTRVRQERGGIRQERGEVRQQQSNRIGEVLAQPASGRADGWRLAPSGAVPRWHRLGGLWHLRRAKASWQAAYNAACLYAALADAALAGKEADQDLVVACLRSAIGNPRSEMERGYDWISRDPDLSFLKDRDSSRESDPATTEGTPFQKFLEAQKRLDYPAAFPAERPGARRRGRHGRSNEQPRQSKADLTTAGDG